MNVDEWVGMTETDRWEEYQRCCERLVAAEARCDALYASETAARQECEIAENKLAEREVLG